MAAVKGWHEMVCGRGGEKAGERAREGEREGESGDWVAETHG